MREYNAESPKQDSERFNSQGRRNTLPIWVYNLSMVGKNHFYQNEIPTKIQSSNLKDGISKLLKCLKQILVMDTKKTVYKPPRQSFSLCVAEGLRGHTDEQGWPQGIQNQFPGGGPTLGLQVGGNY